jgi:hypothetical protein
MEKRGERGERRVRAGEAGEVRVVDCGCVTEREQGGLFVTRREFAADRKRTIKILEGLCNRLEGEPAFKREKKIEKKTLASSD